MSASTILLVDDEDQVRDVLGDILRRDEHIVLEAGNYYEAIRLAESAPIDLLVADVSLPGPNGCELAVRLVNRQPSLQVLFISGYTGAEACRAYGILESDSHFLGKPFEPAALVARVRDLLRESAEHRLAFTRTMRGARPY
ncbi:MAG TPA: response regulator [Bryobacteraceae bacterium]|nr:response regulator [Bryobacteraceae bacterium]